MGDLKCHECGKALDRPYQPGTLPTCTSCVKKFLSKVMDTTWFGEPKRIKRKRKSIQDLGFEPALINKVSKIGRVYKRAIQLEQCNPLETNPLTRFGLLTENKIKPGFNPVIVEGLDVEIDIEQKIDTLREILPKGYSAFLYYCPYGKKPKAIVSIAVTDEDFVKARNTTGGEAHVFNSTIIRKLKTWKKEHRVTLLGATHDAIIIKFNPIRKAEQLKKLVADMGKFCPDLHMYSDWKIELEEQLRKGSRITLWWD